MTGHPRHFGCTVKGCDQPHYAKTLCRRHYDVARNGGPDERPLAGELQTLLFELAAIETDECVIWPHVRRGHKYVTITIDGRRTYAHRAVCRWAQSPLSSGHTDRTFG